MVNYIKDSKEIDFKHGFVRKFKDVPPIKIFNLLPKDKCDELINYLSGIIQNNQYDYEPDMYRKLWGSDSNHPNVLNDIMHYLTPIARELFKSETLLPSYALWSQYDSPKSNLPPHLDANACTYTIDMCLSQDYMWPLWVEGKEYKLEPNTALCYYGEDQVHWREDPQGQGNVDMIFFHFVEPDHWWFVHGMEYKTIHSQRSAPHQRELKILK